MFASALIASLPGDEGSVIAATHAFPDRFHEPYYPSYIRDDLAARVREASLEVCEERLAFLTKVVVARRPIA